MRRHGVVAAVVVVVVVVVWGLGRSWREHERSAARVSYRNALVVAEIARVDAARRRSPPRTLAELAAVVGRGPSACDDKNEPGPLDDPRAEACPKGSACHKPFFRADWELRRHVESPDTRVWLDPARDVDSAPGKLRVHVSGCAPGDLVLGFEDPDPASWLIASW